MKRKMSLTQFELEMCVKYMQNYAQAVHNSAKIIETPATLTIVYNCKQLAAWASIMVRGAYDLE